MAIAIEGKTINQLLRVDEVTGYEILPMSVYNEEINAYVTRGIVINDFFKILYNKFNDIESELAYTNESMSSYVSYLETADEVLAGRQNNLEDELRKTNTYVSYNAEGIIKVHSELRDHIVESDDHFTYIDNEQIVQNNRLSALEEGSGEISYDISYIKEEQLMQNGKINSLEDITDTHTRKISYIEDEQTVQNNRLCIVEDTVTGHTRDIGYINAKVSYIETEQETQNQRIGANETNIVALAEGLAYQSYVNTIQSGHINTLYYENSDDAFDDISKPDDDNVKPQN